MTQAENSTRIFQAERPRLARLAYRMLASLSEAEDVVQNAWLRWREVDPAQVANPPAFLSRIVTRLCLDHMKSARVRRETYVGSWLPEPLVEEEVEDTADDLSLTLMMALERLSPLERAAFLLHDVFDVSFDEVAVTLDRDAPAIRQLAARARRHVRDARPRYPVAREEGERIASAFFEASRSGDTGRLRAMLADNVVIHSDGGGKVFAFPNPIVGMDRVLRLFEGLAHKYGAAAFEMVSPMWIDGLPGFASLEHGALLQTTALEIEDGRITAIYVTRNPDKLEQVTRKVAQGRPPTPPH
jgi:RNA polymerase sigma factor (sigma-70 family)